MRNRRPMRRDDGWPTPGDVAHSAINIILAIVIVICAILGFKGLSKKYAEYKANQVADGTPVTESTFKHNPTHDSLQISYTYDENKQVRWYVFVDPDTQQEYLFNDLGGCTPRLGADGETVMSISLPYSSDE